MKPLLGCIGDDFTGSTDLANNLVRQGMRVVQLCGVPTAGMEIPEADAFVVSLKCRSIPAPEAVSQCREALAWLRGQGCRQFYWKYCSTFDSTAEGNIGPVTAALLQDLGGDVTLVCPAFPETGRTIYQGRLFVGAVPLDESSMRDHPVTPMRDSSLQRLMAAQVHAEVGLLPWETIRKGAPAVRQAIDAQAHKGVHYLVADAIENSDLFVLGEACRDMPLVTGGSGLALGLAENFHKAGLTDRSKSSACEPDVKGPTAILSGSCSEATRGQLERFALTGMPMRRLDPLLLAKGPQHYEETLAWALAHLHQPLAIHGGADPQSVAEVQQTLGKEQSGLLLEDALARLAIALRDAGVRRFIVAGGETSGAVVNALALQGLHIGPQIAPGVPWTVSIDRPCLALALKSGNFGGPDFFAAALDMLPWPKGSWRS